ncbi:MAG: CPBP family intramembrane metalloprotease [Desulfobacterales bacterium]|nr:CPBP family intramembrane metalloprotease [Desulfobacterales bacterium]
MEDATPDQAVGPGDPSSAFEDLPNRYAIQHSESESYLTCLEMPNIAVFVQSGLSFSASTIRKSPSCRIYLDGVAQCEPFMDLEKHVYNFDHHEGVVRPFTLATCEQVMVMVMKGMDLRGRDWKIYANDPDLDTVLAIWLLLNHVRINQKAPDDLKGLYTLVRLESLIDAHGLELIHLSGLPIDLLNKTRKIIDYLREEEIDLKRHAIWEESDFLEHTALVLQKIDRLIYRSDEFLDFQDLKELSRVEIVNNRFAVAVASPQGIYEIEPFLIRLYGENIAIVILQNESGGYTLRRMDHFMPGDLKPIYNKLNFLDPVVRCRNEKNQWGGSGDIGGSPRGVGTQLTPREIAEACRDVFRPPTIMQRTLRFFHALAVVALVTGAAALIQRYLPQTAWFQSSQLAAVLSQSDLIFYLGVILFSALVLAIYSRGRLWQVGLGAPTGRAWWLMLPVGAAAALMGGVPVPWAELPDMVTGFKIFYAVLLIPLAGELLFRGLVHGIVAKHSRVQRCDNGWALSFPNISATIMYAAFPALIMLGPDHLPLVHLGALIRITLAAIVFSLAAGLARERSHSLLPGILFQAAAAALLIFVTGALFGNPLPP